MRITEVRIKLTEETDDRLQAFCSVTFDDSFVVRDLKIIEGTNGPFVAMPSRKLTAHCPCCGSKNHLRAIYCNQCGGKQDADRAVRNHEGRAKLYADIAHPINSECREMIQKRVVADYRKERELSHQPGYVSRYEDEFDDDFAPPAESPAPAPPMETEQVESVPEKREHTIVEPAAAEPRAPHTTVTNDASRKKLDRATKKPGGFGSGILDE
jgi:stage V sporulation protein G